MPVVVATGHNGGTLERVRTGNTARERDGPKSASSS